MSKFEREMGGVVGGLAAVESADSQAVESVYNSLLDANGAPHIPLMPAETQHIFDVTGNLVDISQGVAYPVAVAFGLAAIAKGALEYARSKHGRS